ncbi:hypothetical protein FHS82_000349 [Pseudochelatococcus lubricantis]|uniref:DUF192 domain-containing protein n=1 Tax=Pseudochelatococcus lubricantis TaxID=1538102 RepID=A0ABX0UU95_9HYPH|nr:DUF192 domain-containing protein [Pseudochelatococcus lubricantis]NIJ56536.1 hypothetical protein [Pseudochelatococcus lubricantis]
MSTTKLSRRDAGAFLAGLLMTVGLALSPAAIARAPSILPTEPLTIVTASGRHSFVVEVARSQEEQALGLMGRRYLPADRGMIFDYTDAQPVAMWMENTFISLDMLFVDAQGRIVRIAERTEPLSRRIIPSGGPVRAVIELNAGTAARIGAAVGDSVELSFIAPGR